jgi:outer membrane murein-binding lipoprotein Lpp
MRWPSALLVVSSAVLLAGCGSSDRHHPSARPAPRIPAAVARQLAADADAVASAQGCAARAPAKQLLDDVIASSDRLPARYQEPLTSAANELYARIPACPPPRPKPGKGHKPKHGHGHGPGHGHKKHGGDGD